MQSCSISQSSNYIRSGFLSNLLWVNGHCDGDGDGVGCIADGDGVGCIANKHWTCIITQLRYCGNKSVDLGHSNGHCGDGDGVGVGVSVGIGVSVLVGSGNETL